MTQNEITITIFTYGATLFDYLKETHPIAIQEQAKSELIRRGFSEKEVDYLKTRFNEGGKA